MALSEHKPYSPLKKDGTQEFNAPMIRTVELLEKRMMIRDTDKGKELQKNVDSLMELLDAYKRGEIKEVY